MPEAGSTTGDSPSRRRPRCVAVQAYYHWAMSGTVLASVSGLYFLTRNSPVIGMSTQGYAILLGLGLLYSLTGALVWFGLRPGLYLNYGCSLIYLARPRLGLALWADMRRPEFKAHFGRRNDHSNPVSRRGAKPQSGNGEVD